MRRFAFAISFFLLASLFNAPTIAAIKAGSTCPKLGATSLQSGKKFTCIKSGKKLVWNKGVSLPKPTTTPSPTPSKDSANQVIKAGEQCTSSDLGVIKKTANGNFVCKHDGVGAYSWFAYEESTPSTSPTPAVEYTTFTYPWKNPCDKDPWVPAQWKNYEEFALKTFGCSRPYRFVEVTLPSTTPTSNLVSRSQRGAMSTCKLQTSGNSHSNLGHVPNRWLFTGDVQIQVIPIEFTDYKGQGNPSEEYGKYLEYISDMYYKISDGNTKVTFRTPSNYFQIGKSIKDYVLPGVWTHGQNSPEWKVIDVEKYKKDVFNVADANLNFSGVKMSIVLVPLSMPAEYIAHTPEFRFDNVQTNEGQVPYNYLMPPASQVNKVSWYGVEPYLHLHEFFHANGLLEDHYGDDMGKSGPDLGTGFWGHMSGMLTDFIVWDKWLSGMLVDSQVICANTSVSGNYWITPATYFGKNEKLLVIPLGGTKAIVIESQRQAGVNYKLTKESIGALVFVLDTAVSAHGKGINVIRPENRNVSVNSTSFVLSDAPLKLGESLTTNGYRITVVESGDFGDVVKVEKL